MCRSSGGPNNEKMLHLEVCDTEGSYWGGRGALVLCSTAWTLTSPALTTFCFGTCPCPFSLTLFLHLFIYFCLSADHQLVPTAGCSAGL